MVQWKSRFGDHLWINRVALLMSVLLHLRLFLKNNNFQLHLFNLNLQFHDSFHPPIGEPNRGGGRDTQI